MKATCALIASLSFALVATANDKQIFSIEDLQNQSHDALKESESAAKRLQTLQSQSVLQQQDRTFLTFRIDGYEFPALLLPNERIAPAIVQNNRRTPACIDNRYQLHPGRYDAASGRVVCNIRQADLLINQQVKQTAAQPLAADVPATAAATLSDASNGVNGLNNSTAESTDGSAEPPPSVSTQKYSAATKVPSPVPAPAPKVPSAAPPSDIYLPPIRSASNNRSSNTQSIETALQQEFGVRKGTWASVRINRRISSADIGEIEIELIERVAGKYRDLPSGTLLFAATAYNEGTDKMTIRVTNALLPDADDVVRLEAYAYDLQREAGLSGTVVRNRDGEVKAASSTGALTALSTAVSSVPVIGSNPISAGVSAATDQLINTEQDYLPDNPSAVIEVPKQRFFIQFSQSF